MSVAESISKARVSPELRAAFPGPLLERFLAAYARLAGAGYGPAVPSAFRRTAAQVANLIDAETALALAGEASRVAIRIRPRNAALYLDTAVAVAPKLSGDDFARWRDLLLGLLKSTPEAVQPLLETSGKLLDRLTVDDFAAFIRTGVLLTAADPKARAAFFRLETPEARRELSRHAGELGFRDLEPALKAYHTAIWGRIPLLREAEENARQPSFLGNQIRLPASYEGHRGREREISRAAVSHIGAHQAFSGARFPLAQLKPMHVAVISLIEDARVESLAISEMPGLARIWRPFHDCSPDGVSTAPSLFARLARALIDPDFPVRHGWVAKGLKMFNEARPDLRDPGMSRRMGNILANDLGQTRVQFNFRDYLVRPIYRDDNLGLWELPDDDHATPETEVAAPTEGRRSEASEMSRPRRGMAADSEEVEPARGRGANAERGAMILRLPEYDRTARVNRPDWVTANTYEPALGDPLYLDGVRQRHGATLVRLKMAIARAEMGQARRLRRQAEGDRLDLDAAVDAAIALRAGRSPDHRVYESRAFAERSVAVHVMLDISQSTGDPAGEGVSILDMERDAAAILADAMDQLGDRLAITGFCSVGREDLRLVPVKRFDEDLGIMTGMAFSGLRPGFSTRMGAAIRYAGKTLAGVARHHRLVLVLTDGEPSDIDVNEPDYLRADAQRAVQGLRAQGIATHCIALGKDSGECHSEIFGRHGFVRVADLTTLPEKLSSVYLKMTA